MLRGAQASGIDTRIVSVNWSGEMMTAALDDVVAPSPSTSAADQQQQQEGERQLFGIEANDLTVGPDGLSAAVEGYDPAVEMAA